LLHGLHRGHPGGHHDFADPLIPHPEHVHVLKLVAAVNS
jgi:hypothetical protein